MSIHLTPLSSGNADADGGADSAEAQMAFRRVARYKHDQHRQREEQARYETIEANCGSSNAGIIDPAKFPKRKKD